MIRSPDTIIYELGWRLADGTQLSGQECPFCARLGHTEKSMSIQRTAVGINYQCHRAKCGVKGHVRAAASQGRRLPINERIDGGSKYATYLRSLGPTKAEANDWMWDKWGWEEEHRRIADAQWSYSARRLALPIYDTEEKEVGYTLRDVTGQSSTKSMILLTKVGALSMSYYKGKANEKKLVVVEDQASAVRASRYCSAVALLGVHLDGQRSARLHRLNLDAIVFCLDPDAWNKSVLYNANFGGSYKSTRAVRPDKDLKNMKEEELKKFLVESCGITLETADAN